MKTSTSLLLALFIVGATHGQQHGIINNTESPYVKLKSIDIGDCRWTTGFWADKYQECEEVMIPYMGSLLKGDIGHGYNNFKIAAGLMKGKHEGFAWHDGDFYKWMEAACYVYALNKDEKILKELDEIIEVIAKVQRPDGYLHTETQIEGIAPYSNRKYHEMYNSGHLMTAACIHYRVTGKTNFLNIALKNADLLYTLFQPQPKELARFGFNQTQIMGLVELYRTNKDKRYLELAEIFINMRGKSKMDDDASTAGYPLGDMVQERVPLRKETEAVGHAVLALYFYAGAADVYAETGEQALIDALDRLWDNVVNKKMYVTGAVGQAHYGRSSRKDKIEEGFIDAYMMPNSTAYNETCANICNSMFNYRMLGVKGESKYADVVELVLFNSALSGIGLGGKDYFYSNPLRLTHGVRDYAKMNTESPVRTPYIKCFCCPPNLVRTIAQVSGWAYSLSSNGVAVNLYGGNKLSTKLPDGSVLKLKQDTLYPWDGAVTITIETCKQAAFEIMLRIPEWAEGSTLLVNGKATGVEVTPGKFATVTREWRQGDVIALNLPMNVTLVEGHPLIEEVRNQVAIKRGPIVYCMESPDLPAGARVLDAYLPADPQLVANYEKTLLGGLTTISGDVMLRQDTKVTSKGMYHAVGKPSWETVKTKFIPYYAWSNRGQSEMTVWMPISWEKK